VDIAGTLQCEVGDMLMAMHRLAHDLSCSTDTDRDLATLSTVVERLAREAYIELDNACEQLGAVRMGVFDPDEVADELAAKVQS
jgi:hypothetical protein